jgi:hypothetical protein
MIESPGVFAGAFLRAARARTHKARANTIEQQATVAWACELQAQYWAFKLV